MLKDTLDLSDHIQITLSAPLGKVGQLAESAQFFPCPNPNMTTEPHVCNLTRGHASNLYGNHFIYV